MTQAGLWRRFAGKGAILSLSLLPVFLGLLWLAETPESTQVASTDLGGLPVSGDRTTAEQAGLTDCHEDGSWGPRCRKADVEIAGVGGLIAEVDLDWPEERFDQITLIAANERELTALKDALIARGYQTCQANGALHLVKSGSPIRLTIENGILPPRSMIATADTNDKPVCD